MKITREILENMAKARYQSAARTIEEYKPATWEQNCKVICWSWLHVDQRRPWKDLQIEDIKAALQVLIDTGICDITFE